MQKFDGIAINNLVNEYCKEEGYSGTGKDAFVWDDPDLIKALYAKINESDDHVVFYDQIANVEELHSATISASVYWQKIHKSIILEWEVQDSFKTQIEFVTYVSELERQAIELLANINK